METSQLKLFSEVGRESTMTLAVTPLHFPCFVGPLGLECSETTSQFDQQWHVVVVTAIGTPIEEALVMAGLSNANAVISLELDGDLLLVMKSTRFWETQPVDLWLEWLISVGDTAEVPRVDWSVAICPHPPMHSGKRSWAVSDWAQKMMFLADTLAKFGALHVAMFLLLYQWMP